MSQPIRAALITGGARRVGAAIARDLADAGFAVAIHCRTAKAQADALADAIGRAGGRAAVVEADLTDLSALPGLIAAARDALGPIDLLVNNAATFARDSASDLDPAGWQRQMTVNLAAPVFLAKSFAAALPGDAEGNIINIIDQRVWKPVPDFFSYQLSKSALLAATVALAQALAPRIRVNAIGPGPVLPSLRQSAAHFRRQVETLPLGRGPGLAEFGRTIRFLVDTPSVTGQMIALDGGQHLAWQTPDVTAVPE